MEGAPGASNMVDKTVIWWEVGRCSLWIWSRGVVVEGIEEWEGEAERGGIGDCGCFCGGRGARWWVPVGEGSGGGEACVGGGRRCEMEGRSDWV